MSETSRRQTCRGDIDCFCPRVNREILILSNVCLSGSPRKLCNGCVYDIEHLRAGLLRGLIKILTGDDFRGREP